MSFMKWLLICVCLLLSGAPAFAASSKSCAAMTRDLARLRTEYHAYVTSPAAKDGGITFDDLTQVVDKIVDLKNDMRKAGCKIRPRTQ